MNDTCAVCLCARVQIGNSANRGWSLKTDTFQRAEREGAWPVLELWVETSLAGKIHTQNAKFCSNSKSWA